MIQIMLTINTMNEGDPTVEVVMEWLNEIIQDKSHENVSPLRYVDKVELIKRETP